MKKTLLFTFNLSRTFCLLLVLCLCCNYGWSQNLMLNPTCDDHTWSTGDNADAYDITPNNEVNDNTTGALITSPYQPIWDNDALETWLEGFYNGGNNIDEQPGSTSSGNGGTRGIKLYMDTAPSLPGVCTRRIYQKVEGLTIGKDYIFSVESRADVDTTPDSEVYILNTEIVDEVALNTDGGAAAGIRDGFMAVPATTSYTTYSTTFMATNTFVVVYIRSLGAVDDQTETFWDNFSLVEDSGLSVDDKLASNFKIYPNPAKDYITIDANNVNISTVKVFDLLGKNIFTQKGLDNNKINVSGFSKGIYLLNIEAEEGSLSKKIVIE